MATIASLNVLLGVNSANFQRGMAAAGADVRRFEGRTQRSFSAIRTAYIALAGVFAAGALTRGITEAADTLTNINNQLRAAGIETTGLANAQANVVALADQTRSSLEATGGLYARILRSSRELGVSQEQALQITRAFQQTLALSGAETSEAQAAALQFGQALASGRLQGDELRSILENNSFFAQEFAKELGVGVGQLREMGKNGELTSELLADVALRIAPRINSQFQGLSATFAQSGQVLRNRVVLGMAELGQAIREALPDITELARGIGDRLQGAIEETARVVRVLAANGEAVRVIFTSLAATIGTLLIPRVLALATTIAGALAQSILFLLSPIGSIIAALVAISVIGALAWDPIRDTAIAVWDRILIGAESMGVRMELLFLSVKDSVVGIFEGIANGVLEAINFAIRQLNRASNALGGGNVADELGLFGGGSGSADRIAQLRTELAALQEQAAMANGAIVGGIGDIGGVLGESVATVQGLIDQLFGGANAPDLSAPALGMGGAGAIPDPTGEGLFPGGNNPLELSSDQQDRLGQSLYDGIDRGLQNVLSGNGDFGDFAATVNQSIQSSLIDSFSSNVVDFLKDSFGDQFKSLGESASGALKGLGDTISGLFSSIFGGGGGFGSFFGGIFHNGGIVPGRSGQDVPILAQAGEAVLTKEQQEALFSGRSSGQTVNQTIQVTGDVTEATRRAVREMSGEIANNTRSHFVEQGVVS